MHDSVPEWKTLSARTWPAGPNASRVLPGLLLSILLGVTALPAPAEAQSIQQILQVVQEGGAWLSLPIEDGRGSYRGVKVPTMGMSMVGWFQIADVHRGDWSIKVVDVAGGSEVTVVETQAKPGQRVPVVYDSGATIQVNVDVAWSELADTVLWVWVGLPAKEPDR